MITIQQLILITYICMMGVFFVNNGCAMQVVPYEQHAQQFINEFSSMNFEGAHKNWQKLSLEAKQYINKAEQERNKGKPNWIFDIVTTLPPEIHKNIMRFFFDGNSIAADKFLTPSMKRAFGLWEWAHDVYDGKRCPLFNGFNRIQKWKTDKDNNSLLALKVVYYSEMSHADIFNYSKGIMLFDIYNGEKASSLSLNDIKELDALFSYFKDKKELRGLFNQKKHTYVFYKARTLANFLTAVREIFFEKREKSRYAITGFSFWIVFLSTVLVSSWSSQFIESRYCHKIIMPDIVLKNEKRRLLNMIINQSEHAEVLSDYLKPIKDPMDYSIIDFFKMKSPYLLLPGPALVSFLLLDEYMRGGIYHTFKELIYPAGIGLCFGAILLSISLLPSIISNFLLCTLPATLFVGSMFYVFCSCFGHMLRKHTAEINWKKISELLNREDIIIQ